MGCSRLNKIFCCCTWEILKKRKLVVSIPELVQPFKQGCPLMLGNIPLKCALTEIRDPFQQVGGYFNSKVGLGSTQGLHLQDFHPIGVILY